MGIFDEFAHRHTDCILDGVAEKVILSRDSRSTSIIAREYIYNGLFAPTSAVKTGSLVVTDESFLVQSRRSSPEGNKSCTLVKTNSVIEIQRCTVTYDTNDNPIGESFDPVQSNVKAYVQYVTAHLRQLDIGLLPTTAYTLLVQSTVNVKRPQDTSLVMPDRIVLNGRPYQVDVIDDVKTPGLYNIQLSEDIR
ncbi:MAG: hypothetical protein JWM44_1329 [Bacilli bacterium]|nr:hypothetical protein [Bacilli bacterium]